MFWRNLKHSLRIVIAIPSQALRQTLADALRRNGFSKVISVATLKEVWEYLELGEVDWVISTFYAESTINALHILRVCALQPDLSKVRLSLIVEPEDLAFLPVAFEWGLMSFHARIESADEADREIQRLLAVVDDNGADDCLVAADYLWGMLSQQNQVESMIDLQLKLSDLYPSEPRILLRLAEGYLRSRNREKGRMVLDQAKVLFPDERDRAEIIWTRFTGIANSHRHTDDLASGLLSPLGFKRVMILDSDQSARNIVKDVIKSLGVFEIHEFSDGQSAYDWLKGNRDKVPDLIITEWIVPKLSVLSLLQRMGENFLLTTRVLVLSSQVSIEDLTMLHELGISDLATKPCDSRMLISSLSSLARRADHPANFDQLRHEVLGLLAKGEIAKAISVRGGGKIKLTPAQNLLIDAEIAFSEDDYETARDLAHRALVQGADSLLALSLIGKALLKLRDFKLAAEFFKKAQIFSPLNIPRLCHLVESYVEQDDFVRADAFLSQAIDIDSDNSLVHEAQAKIGLAQGDEAKAREAMAKLDGFNTLVSFINNRGIMQARGGEVVGGIELYRMALNCLPPKKAYEVRGVLHYNIALAYLRLDAPRQSLAALTQFDGPESTAIAKKISKLKARVEKAIESKRKIRLVADDFADQFASDPEEAPQNFANRKPSVTILLRKGDYCCHRIFFASELATSYSQRILTPVPRFFPH